MKKYIITESFGNFEIWRSDLLNEKDAYIHLAELRADSNRGEIKLLEYLPIKNHILN